MEFTFGTGYGFKISPDAVVILELELGLDEYEEELSDYLERYLGTIKDRWVIDYDFYGSSNKRGYVVFLDHTFLSGSIGIQELGNDPLDGKSSDWDEALLPIIEHLQLNDVRPSWLAWGYASYGR